MRQAASPTEQFAIISSRIWFTTTPITTRGSTRPLKSKRAYFLKRKLHFENDSSSQRAFDANATRIFFVIHVSIGQALFVGPTRINFDILTTTHSIWRKVSTNRRRMFRRGVDINAPIFCASLVNTYFSLFEQKCLFIIFHFL